MIYLDTSLIVAALTDEVGNDRIWEWLGRLPAGTLFTSQWTETEISSALSFKVRTQAITVNNRADAMAIWRRWQSESVVIFAVESAHLSAAARYADRHELSLRAGDALHIAIAAASGFTLATLDATMANAAPLLGVPVEPLG